jgi:3-oxoacyl-[acyl-carrier-protein] synthase II
MYDLPCKVAAKIDTPALYSNLLKKNLIKNSDLKSMSIANVYALVTAEEAIKDSGWSARNEIDSYRAGTSIGTGMAGIQEVSEAAVALYKDNLKGIKTLSPYFIPKILPNLSAGLVSIKHKLKVEIHR